MAYSVQDFDSVGKVGLFVNIFGHNNVTLGDVWDWLEEMNQKTKQRSSLGPPVLGGCYLNISG